MCKHKFQKLVLLFFTVLFLCASDVVSQAPRPSPRRTFKLQLEVSAGTAKVEGARVLVVSEEEGVSFSKETRTNQNGVASASAVPEGKIHIQVIAKECETFGSFITLTGDQMVQVSLVKRTPTPSPAPAP